MKIDMASPNDNDIPPQNLGTSDNEVNDLEKVKNEEVKEGKSKDEDVDKVKNESSEGQSQDEVNRNRPGTLRRNYSRRLTIKPEKTGDVDKVKNESSEGQSQDEDQQKETVKLRRKISDNRNRPGTLRRNDSRRLTIKPEKTGVLDKVCFFEKEIIKVTGNISDPDQDNEDNNANRNTVYEENVNPKHDSITELLILRKEYETNKKKINKMEEENQSMGEKLKNLEEENVQLKVKIDGNNTELNNLRKENESDKNKIIEFGKEKQSAEEKVKNLEKEIVELKVKVEDLSLRLSDSNNAVDQSSKNLMIKAEQLPEKSHQNESASFDPNDSFACLIVELDNLRKENFTFKARINTLEHAQSNNDANVKVSMDTKSQVPPMSLTLVENDNSKMHIANLENEVKELREQNGKLKKIVDAVEKQKKELTEIVDDSTVRIHEMEIKLEILQTEVTLLKDQNGQLEEKIQDAERQKINLKATVDNSAVRLLDMEERLTALNINDNDVISLQDVNRELEEKIQKFKKLGKDLETSLTALEDENELLKSNLKKEGKNLKNQIEIVKEKSEDISSLEEKLKQSKAKDKEKIEKMEVLLEEKETKIKKLELQINRLRRQNYLE